MNIGYISNKFLLIFGLYGLLYFLKQNKWLSGEKLSTVWPSSCDIGYHYHTVNDLGSIHLFLYSSCENFVKIILFCVKWCSGSSKCAARVTISHSFMWRSILLIKQNRMIVVAYFSIWSIQRISVGALD